MVCICRCSSDYYHVTYLQKKVILFTCRFTDQVSLSSELALTFQEVDWTATKDVEIHSLRVIPRYK